MKTPICGSNADEMDLGGVEVEAPTESSSLSFNDSSISDAGELDSTTTTHGCCPFSSHRRLEFRSDLEIIKQGFYSKGGAGFRQQSSHVIPEGRNKR